MLRQVCVKKSALVKVNQSDKSKPKVNACLLLIMSSSRHEKKIDRFCCTSTQHILLRGTEISPTEEVVLLVPYKNMQNENT